MQLDQLINNLPITKLKNLIESKKDWTDIFDTNNRLIVYTDKDIINIVRYEDIKYYVHSTARIFDSGTFSLKDTVDKLDKAVAIKVIKDGENVALLHQGVN